MCRLTYVCVLTAGVSIHVAGVFCSDMPWCVLYAWVLVDCWVVVTVCVGAPGGALVAFDIVVVVGRDGWLGGGRVWCLRSWLIMVVVAAWQGVGALAWPVWRRVLVGVCARPEVCSGPR